MCYFVNLKDIFFLIIFMDVINVLGSTAENSVGGTMAAIQHLAFIYFNAVWRLSGATNKAFAKLSQRDRKQ